MPYFKMYPKKSLKRRLEVTSSSLYRSEFRRDFGRLIHCPAFRRLQGKPQLFPGQESDFFRSRLTHSLEVAQIAKSIALRLNEKIKKECGPSYLIDTDLIEIAGLAHDIGHPPFGHIGEEALDKAMMSDGGFEGNAQTLRVLSKLEKKHLPDGTILGINKKKGLDMRLGLNLTFRSLASVLKYDREIPLDKAGRLKLQKEGVIDELSPIKGYYHEEISLVEQIKEHVFNGKKFEGYFKTIECQIMNFADDIAYSCYDLEDSLKAGFITPLQIIALPTEILKAVTVKVNKSLSSSYKPNEIQNILEDIFKELFDVLSVTEGTELPVDDFESDIYPRALKITHKTSQSLASCGYQRTAFTSKYVGTFVNSIDLSPDFNKSIPALSSIQMSRESLLKVEILKHVTFESQILSPKLKIVERRGKEIVSHLFETLSNGGGENLLPADHREIYSMLKEGHKRLVCDFISGMTDRYALEFYGRLTSENPQTIFKLF